MKPHAQPSCSNDGGPNNKDDQQSLMIKKFYLDMIGDLIVKIQKVALGGWLHSVSANEYYLLKQLVLSSLSWNFNCPLVECIDEEWSWVLVNGPFLCCCVVFS